MNKIYRFEYYCGRMGVVESLFIADEEDVRKIIGKTVRFGEILGKHSYVICDIEKKHFEVLTDDQEFINKFVEIMGNGTISGYNPIEYWEYNREEDEDDDA